ncbi:Glucosamine-6-phosphate deaminase [uncultured archaeon]|nr:Glucosamine-6-phosphate deaminase [uncultured archaeon]
MSRAAADTVVHEIISKPSLVLTLPTGDTPKKMYQLLAKEYRKKRVDFSQVTCFNLDEYYPIKKNNKNSYNYYMNKNFWSHINIKKSNINILNGETKNTKKECDSYERKIRKNTPDLAILGLGINGHVGFNEPGSTLNSKTRLVSLSRETRKRNSKFFGSYKKIPSSALTMGMSTILSSKKIILLASGKSKRQAVKQLVEGQIDSSCPASFLRNHKNLVIILDKSAASFLK